MRVWHFVSFLEADSGRVCVSRELCIDTAHRSFSFLSNKTQKTCILFNEVMQSVP